MAPSVASGVLLMVLSAPLNVGNLALSKHLRRWPYYRLFGIAGILVALGIGAGLALTRAPLPAPAERKWIVLRGSFAVANFVLMITAISQGTPLGDVASLASVNMVAAAFLGRVLLGEGLRPLHFLGLGCALLGALLIARPSFLFPGGEGHWPGYIMALASGFFLACVYVCSRKAAAASPWLHLCSAMLQGGLAGLLLPLLPVVEEPDWALVEASPLLAAGWLAVVAAFMLLGGVTMSLAAQRCPAALSATVNTAMRMVCSYAAQALFFGEALNAVTLAGAALMLLSVAIMAGVGCFPKRQAPEAPEAEADEASETESLASFIAAEFVGCAQEASVRQRRGPEAQQLGAMAAVASVAI